jgi:GTP 3',8-cyclase
MKYFRRKNKIASHLLEFNVAEHCNLRCAECSHLSPYVPPKAAQLSVFKKDLKALAKIYHCQVFKFVGGEPLLNKNLIQFINEVRDSGICDEIAVSSNGIKIKSMSDDFFCSIDKLDINQYPNTRCTDHELKFVTEKCNSFKTALKISQNNVFRKTQPQQPIYDQALVKNIYDSCNVAHVMGCHAFADGYFYLCSRPIFTAEYLKAKGFATQDFSKNDGIPLHKPNLYFRLQKYLERSTPLDSCKYCLGSVGQLIPHRQLSSTEIHESFNNESDYNHDINIKLMKRHLLTCAVFGFVKKHTDSFFIIGLFRKLLSSSSWSKNL